MQNLLSTILGLVAVASSLAIPTTPIAKRDSISITPHDRYSSSIGVLGCKINTNRVAYFPYSPSCDSMCVKVSSQGLSVHLLHVDSSGGAYDMSYDAWNFLKTGQSAAENPVEGGGFDAEVEGVGMEQCEHLITGPSGKLALSAANSVNFFVSCPKDSWVGKNAELVNICDSVCNYGVDEVCQLDLGVSNQPSCPSSILGDQTLLKHDDVWNVIYGTGKQELAVL